MFFLSLIPITLKRILSNFLRTLHFPLFLPIAFLTHLLETDENVCILENRSLAEYQLDIVININ